jgi:sterol desaturase/sphingolipid hydroxylase (fatty acid hydroxylase superfamily)
MNTSDISAAHAARVSLFFNRLRAYITQDFDGPLLTKCKRWFLASLCVAFAVSFIIFGAFLSAGSGFWLASRMSFSLFWLSFGVGVIVSVFGIYWWLTKWEADPAQDPGTR